MSSSESNSFPPLVSLSPVSPKVPMIAVLQTALFAPSHVSPPQLSVGISAKEHVFLNLVA